MAKINVKEKLSGKRLDLSMCELDAVPVEDMVTFTLIPSYRSAKSATKFAFECGYISEYLSGLKRF